MARTRARQRVPQCLTLLVCLVLVSACGTRQAARPFVTGLDQPRGMAFNSEGHLYLAEAGAVDQLGPGTTPAETNHSGRVVRITPDRQLITVLDGLPYTHYEETGDTGVSDVAFVGSQLYILTGEGYDDDLSRRVLRVTDEGASEVVANILQFAIGMSTSQELQIGYVVSNPYAMVAGQDGSLYVSDAASGRVLQISVDGAIRVFVELPMMPLTGMAFGPDGRLYVAMFSLRPHAPGSGAVWAIDGSGHMSVAVDKLTMPVDVAFGADGIMYVLEFSDGRQPDRPYTTESGRLLRIEVDGTHTTVLERLSYPTAMTFSPSSDLYIATGGAFTPAGEGEILRVECRSLGTEEVCTGAQAR